MSAELIGILGVGATLLAVNLTTTMFFVAWLRNIDRRLAVLEGIFLSGRAEAIASGD